MLTSELDSVSILHISITGLISQKKQMAQQHPRPQGFSGRRWKGRKKGKRPRDEVGTTSYVFYNELEVDPLCRLT